MSSPETPVPCPPGRGARIAPPFDGYPYLITRIGHSALRHIALLPAAWARDRLVDLAARQAEANQLETCLCLGPADAVYATPGQALRGDPFVPSGNPVIERLALPELITNTDVSTRRRTALRAYAKRYRGDGYIVGDGLEGGRPARAVDIPRLSGLGVDGLPPGLARCRTCSGVRGDYLALHGEGSGEMRPRVIRVHCRCDNHNRCARCGEPLAAQRLSAYYWLEPAATVCYVAAYCALSHRCPGPPRTGAPARFEGVKEWTDDDWFDAENQTTGASDVMRNVKRWHDAAVDAEAALTADIEAFAMTGVAPSLIEDARTVLANPPAPLGSSIVLHLAAYWQVRAERAREASAVLLASAHGRTGRDS